MKKKVELFIAGVQKAGTTALFDRLSQDPRFCVPDRKELHFFDDESVDWSRPDYSFLDRSFPTASGAGIWLDATPIYTYWPNALSRMATYNPNAKLIVMLRHPAFRAYSHWRMETIRGHEDLTFEDAISDIGRKRFSPDRGGVHRRYSYLERGMYARQLEAVYASFPKESVLVIRTDQYWLQQDSCLGEIYRFVGLTDVPTTPKRYVTPYHTDKPSQISQQNQLRLTEYFAYEIGGAQTLSGIDMIDWLEPDYVEPMARPD